MRLGPQHTRQAFQFASGRQGLLHSLPALEAAGIGRVSRLPVSLRIVLESLLPHLDGRRITEAQVRVLANWEPRAPRSEEIPFVVARILLQNFTGVPLLCELAAMRDAAQRFGHSPRLVEPVVPVDLVVDHSVQVDHFREANSLDLNMRLEFRRNAERYRFIKWGMQAFDGFRVVPPGIGIVHQVNLEHLARGVHLREGVTFPDSVVGTDSHTTMINALGVLAWGVVSFMSYIDVLTRIGRVSHTIETVERATGETLERYARAPLSGARAAAEPPAGAKPVHSTLTGRVQFVDVDALQALAEGCDGQVHASASPGDLVHPMSPLACLLTTADDATAGRGDLAAGVRKAFVIGSERTVEQGAAYGLIMLAEIAQRALSPAVNDPGAAIAVLGSQTCLLVQTFRTPEDADAKVRDRVTAVPAVPEAVVAIAYEPIARCSAGQFASCCSCWATSTRWCGTRRRPWRTWRRNWCSGPWHGRRAPALMRPTCRAGTWRPGLSVSRRRRCRPSIAT